jgi:hypothetical protein
MNEILSSITRRRFLRSSAILASTDLFLTQRLILQPRIDTELAVQEVRRASRPIRPDCLRIDERDLGAKGRRHEGFQDDRRNKGCGLQIQPLQTHRWTGVWLLYPPPGWAESQRRS